MSFHFRRAALAALSLAVSSSAFASSLYLGPGLDNSENSFGQPSSYMDGYTLFVTNGEINNSFTPGEPPVFTAPTDVSKFSYTLDLSPDFSVADTMADGTVDGPFSGHYTISYAGTPLSSGTVVAHGTEQFIDIGNGRYFPLSASYSDGLFTQTSGAGIPGFAPGTMSAAFEGSVGFDGYLYFSGSLSDAPAAVTAVPVPASAVTGLGLIGLLGAARLARRRPQTA